MKLEEKRDAIIEVLNNHKMDAPEDVLVFAIEDVPVVVDAILSSLVSLVGKEEREIIVQDVLPIHAGPTKIKIGNLLVSEDVS